MRCRRRDRPGRDVGRVQGHRSPPSPVGCDSRSTIRDRFRGRQAPHRRPRRVGYRSREELITALAQVKGIRVASYGSSLALKGAATDPKTAGALLGVNSIIDGSVRRDGPRLRVTARLSDTSDGTLLWSEGPAPVRIPK